MKKFSVLLSIYFKTKLSQFEECINSINEQTLLPDEILIIQDGPISFNIDLILLKYSKLNFIIIKNEINLGLPKSLNKGLERSKNEIIFRIDSDDICLPNRFMLQFNKFVSNKKLAVLGSNVILIDEESNELNNLRNVPILNKNIKKIIPYKNPFNHPSVVYKKSVVLSVGGYSDLYLYEDWYLWFKISRLNDVELENMNEKLIKYRIRTFNDRKGFNIVKAEYQFYRLLLSKKYINFFVFLLNIITRSLIRLMPVKLYNYIKHQFDRVK